MKLDAKTMYVYNIYSFALTVDLFLVVCCNQTGTGNKSTGIGKRKSSGMPWNDTPFSCSIVLLMKPHKEFGMPKHLNDANKTKISAGPRVKCYSFKQNC